MAVNCTKAVGPDQADTSQNFVAFYSNRVLVLDPDSELIRLLPGCRRLPASPSASRLRARHNRFPEDPRIWPTRPRPAARIRPPDKDGARQRLLSPRQSAVPFACGIPFINSALTWTF